MNRFAMGGVMALAGVVWVGAACAAAAPATKTICGVRDGTAGNASLTVPGKDDPITLAAQGGDQHLLDEADDLIPKDSHGEIGMQNGTRYCVVVTLDGKGEPAHVIKAWRSKHGQVHSP